MNKPKITYSVSGSGTSVEIYRFKLDDKQILKHKNKSGTAAISAFRALKDAGIIELHEVIHGSISLTDMCQGMLDDIKKAGDKAGIKDEDRGQFTFDCISGLGRSIHGDIK